jgi:hypothetical protein
MSSLNLDESTNPAIKTAEIRYPKRGAYILNESTDTNASNEPTPTE